MSFTRKPITGTYGSKLDKIFGIQNAFFEYNPGNFVMPSKYEEIAEKVINFQVKPDDVWLISYPRTGSTWLQEMIWLIGNNLDFEGARKTIQHFRAPILETSAILITDEYKTFMKSFGDSVDLIDNLASPRFIKTHIPLELLPVQLHTVKPKIIYITRNPKDVCVSYYYYCKLVHDANCDFEEFCDLILSGKVPVGNFWSHVLNFWRKRNEPNLLFLKYEDLKKDLTAVIARVAKFMEKSVTDVQIRALYDHLDFIKMKKNRSVNAEPILETRSNMNKTVKDEKLTFIRKGDVGDWKNHMSSEIVERFDRWIQENTQNTDLKF